MIYSIADDKVLVHAHLAQVRRIEAIGFRAMPCTVTYYDGTWAIRLTTGLLEKRLNSLNPLDPSDCASLGQRLKLAEDRFKSFGRPMIIRQSPLAPPELDGFLDRLGWRRFDESVVMVLDLEAADLSNESEIANMKDVSGWVDDYLHLSGEPREKVPGMREIITSVETRSGLFVLTENGKRLAALRCVRQNYLVGIFDLVTGKNQQRKGHARKLVGGALKWAKKQGVKAAWLQVVADNQPALRLYEGFGFTELYRYVYREGRVYP